MIIETADRLKITKEYYFSVKLQEVRSLISGGKDIINIAIGNPDMTPSQETIDELNIQSNNPANHGYQPYRSIPELRTSIKSWTKKVYGVSLDPDDEILPLIGSKEGITHISLAFLNPGDEVLVPELGYPAYAAVTEMIGGRSIKFPMIEDENWKPDINAMRQMDLRKVKLMWINYPNMPTGAPASKKMFEELIEFAAENNILLCHDNPYSLILNQGDPVSILSVEGAKKVAVELNSMSKSHNMAGWRIGWVAGAKDHLDAILKIKSNVDSGMFKPLQLAAVKAFDNPDAWHRKRNLEYRNRRELVYKILDLLSCTYDRSQTGLFIWAKVPDEIGTSRKLADYLLYEKNIFVTPGFVFGDKGDKYIRTSLCVEQEVLKRVIGRLKSFDLSNL
ncbi:MAG: aminotransferase class I/II-fold pyridoxal phosphate-dependent enzyme [Cytophagales bacterium]|nr:aminotransferase class I/II-fold pyridoxal phosphate-dependent enzyme [Cytophagales bacterium]